MRLFMLDGFYMTKDDELRGRYIQKCLDKLMTQEHAARELGMTRRNLQYLIRRYRKGGLEAIVSKNTHQIGNNRYPTHLKDLVVTLYKDKYEGFNLVHFTEKLKKNHDIMISRETARRWLIDKEIWITRDQKKKAPQQYRQRRACFGELIQIDGSYHPWFEDRAPKCNLMVYVDDATSRIVEMRFTESENAHDYMYSTWRYIKRYGRPGFFYSDKHSVFSNNKAKIKGKSTGETDFTKAIRSLGIDILFANSPQAKGRVERRNRDLQDRLVKELRLENISTIEDGNKFLETYMDEFNASFEKEPMSPIDWHRPLSPHIDLKYTFCFRVERKVGKQLTLQEEGITYQIVDSKDARRLAGTRIQVVKHLDGSVELYDGKRTYEYVTFNKSPTLKKPEEVDAKRLTHLFDQKMYEIQESLPKRNKKRTYRATKRIKEEIDKTMEEDS